VGVSRDHLNFWSTPIISGTGKATNFKFGSYIRRVHLNKSSFKIWEKRERGRIQGLPKFFEYPLLSQERVKLRTSNLAGMFKGPSEQKLRKNLGEKGAWAYPVTAQILAVPPIISGPLRPTLPLDWGFATPPQNCNHYYLSRLIYLFSHITQHNFECPMLYGALVVTLWTCYGAL